MKKAFVGFAGFGLVDLVLREAGFETIGVEIDPAVAEVNRINGGHCLTADILDIDPADYIGYYLGHFSPPCPSFSLASQNEESELDIALARWVARFVVVVQPNIFTLENVWAYRNSQSWAIILEALTGTGYGVDWWHLNAADYGVPQTRKRMIAVARFDGRRPQKPLPTHRDTSKDEPGQMGLFEPLPPWLGWYQAIEDLIPDLPDSEFASWQMDRMPAQLRTFLMMTFNTNRNGVDNKSGRGILDIDRPANTVMASEKTIAPRAFIIGGQFQTPNDGTPRTVQNKLGDRPIWTITASENGDTRACLQDRIVSMTPRALARFQGIPDSFKLPGELPFTDHIDLAKMILDSERSVRELTCYGIGNAVPPKLDEAVIKSLRLTGLTCGGKPGRNGTYANSPTNRQVAINPGGTPVKKA